MPPGPKLIKLRTGKNEWGQVTTPASVWLSHQAPEKEAIHISVPEMWVKKLTVGEKIHFRDTRGKKRKLLITHTEEQGVWAECHKTAYLKAGTMLSAREHPPSVFVEDLPAREQPILLQTGDLLIVHRSNDPGELATYQEDGTLVEPAHISCTSEEVFDMVKTGERVLFDDGKIEGVIKAVEVERFVVEITYTSKKEGKLRADKGINFPDSQLQINGLTSKDRKDLPFVVQHADVINLSFVNRAMDVGDVLEELKQYDAVGKIGLILKIETMSGVENLVEILLTAMQTYPLGVMIARGDLAIETGWDNIGFIQEEILWLCQAAHIPTIWATQVLENLAKSGMPSRAEITDATMAQRAECVMLNKGPYILKAIRLLDKIFKKMEAYQEKNKPLTPPLGSFRKWG